MAVWKIEVFDGNWKSLSVDYKRFDDRQQAEIQAEEDCGWLGGAHWEVTKIR